MSRWILLVVGIATFTFASPLLVEAQTPAAPQRTVGRSGEINPSVLDFARDAFGRASNSAVDTIFNTVNPESQLNSQAVTGLAPVNHYEPSAVVRAGQQVQDLVNNPTGAGSITDALTARLVGFIAFMMGLIVSFLGKVILLLVNILLGFLSYNSFADAPPVVTGWKIVRDLANMFFIIILILSSYATILGYKTAELHVKTVLPKILLAAVLVNFSKTIVALLIDASQVVMLTFVNAFAAIGAGNFTNALHLPLITSASYGDQLQQIGNATSSPQIAANGAGQVILDVVLASALQIFLLIVAIGVMLMMIIFVAVRIVALWMLLVFSPIPFLTDALPASMKAMLGKQVSSFWGRLSGLLTGGPIMAFWLWLTFATLSAQGADERLNLFQNTQAADLGSGLVGQGFAVAQSTTSLFITAIGNARGLGSYVIAIAMMLMGLEAAMGAAEAVGGSAGSLMKTVGNKSRDWATRAAKYTAYAGTVGAPILAARGLAKGAGAGAGALNRRYDFSGQAAGFVRKAPILRNSDWLRKQQYAVQNENKKRAMEESKILNDPLASKEDREAELARLNANFGFGDQAAKIAIAEEHLKKGNNPKAYEGELKPVKDAVKKNIEDKAKDKVVAKRVSDRLGKQAAVQKQLNDLERAKQLITGDSKEAVDKRDGIDDAMKKLRKDNPHLITKKEDRDKQMADVRQNFSSLDEDARSNFEVLKNFAADGAFDDSNGRLKIKDEAAILATAKKLRGKDQQNFLEMVKFIRETKGGQGIESDRLANLSVEQDANDNRRVFEVTGSGDKASGEFRRSELRQGLLDATAKEFSAESSEQWAPGGVLKPSSSEALAVAAGVAGVSEIIQNVGRNAKGEADPKLQQAAVTSLANNVGTKLKATSDYLNASNTQGIVDKAGNAKTNAEVLRDAKAPQALKDQISARYQEEISRVLPILDGVNELSSDQQIEFMAAMGAANVGQALNAQFMEDSTQRASIQKIKTVVDENAPKVRAYFTNAGNQANIQAYQDYREEQEYVLSQKGRVLTPEEQLRETEFNELAAGLGAADEAARQAYFAAEPGTEQAYKEHVRNANRTARVAAMKTGQEFTTGYAEFQRNYNARKVISQFRSNGGKGGGASGTRARREGSGGGRGGRGGGGGPATPPAATGGAAAAGTP